MDQKGCFWTKNTVFLGKKIWRKWGCPPLLGGCYLLIFSLIFFLTGSPQRGPSGGQPRVGRWEGLAALGRVPRLAGPLGQPGRAWRTWPEQPAEDLEQDWERGHPVQPGAKRGDLLAFGGLSEPHPGVCALLTCPPKKIITVNQP